MTKKSTQPQDKYVLRFPDGLRDRIKAYAERHGRSMNAEIVRVLEREYPPAPTIEDRVVELLAMLDVLKGSATEPVINKLVDSLVDTINGIYEERITGISEETLANIRNRLDEYRQQIAEYDDAELDEEERGSLWMSGTTKKF